MENKILVSSLAWECCCVDSFSRLSKWIGTYNIIHATYFTTMKIIFVVIGLWWSSNSFRDRRFMAFSGGNISLLIFFAYVIHIGKKTCCNAINHRTKRKSRYKNNHLLDGKMWLIVTQWVAYVNWYRVDSWDHALLYCIVDGIYRTVTKSLKCSFSHT